MSLPQELGVKLAIMIKTTSHSSYDYTGTLTVVRHTSIRLVHDHNIDSSCFMLHAHTYVLRCHLGCLLWLAVYRNTRQQGIQANNASHRNREGDD